MNASHEPDLTTTRDTVAGKSVQVHTGNINGADFRVEVPDDWGGTLLLYSHHYRYLGQPNPATVMPNDVELGPRMDGAALREILLTRGYALAGSAYKSVGWCMEDTLTDQPNLLDWFSDRVGRPSRTIAWGLSAGGLASVLLADEDTRIDGALSLGADIGGVINQMNLRLDAGYAINVLLADGKLELGRISDPAGNDERAQAAINAAIAGDAHAHARLLLAASLAAFPPQLDGHATQAVNVPKLAAHQLGWIMANAHAFVTFGLGRKEIENRAGGNSLWNTDVDYHQAFARSAFNDLVERAYQEAGADLKTDLNALQDAPRVAADPEAVVYMSRYGGDAGLRRLRVPVMTMHTTVDSGAPVEHEQVFADRVRSQGSSHLLRQAFTQRGFTCAFSPAEVAVAIAALDERISTGEWGDTSATALNAATAAYTEAQQRVYSFINPDQTNRYAVLPPGFVDFTPATLPRNPR